jgi:dephospho-CoA kinase
LLGEETYTDEGPDRALIARRVFGNKELLEGLNSIIHPAVREDLARWLEQQQAPYIIQEAAILFENGSYENFDKMILVTAPREARIKRIMERDKSDRASIESRMAHQWEDERKIALTDYVIDNLSLESTRSEVKRIHRQLMEISG